MSVLKKHTFGLLNATYINNVYIIIIFMLTCSYIHPSQTIFFYIHNVYVCASIYIELYNFIHKIMYLYYYNY